MKTAAEVLKFTGASLVLILLIWGAGQVHQAQVAKSTPSSGARLHINTSLPWWDAQRFHHHIQTRLPYYKYHFQKAAQVHGLPWTFLASQAYQESRWNKDAKSPTGVRGIMMLTRNTASSLGVKDRMDPEQSIAGGARYFAFLENQLPPHIQKPDRTWIALAAYNVGMGHIKDAQTLAQRMDKDPHRWEDLKTVLPLLAQKKYYKTLQHGYARGHEPVRYVKRIRAYWELLDRYLGEV